MEKLDDLEDDAGDDEAANSVKFRSLSVPTTTSVEDDDGDSEPAVDQVIPDGSGDANAASGLRQRRNVAGGKPVAADDSAEPSSPDDEATDSSKEKKSQDGSLAKFDSKRDPLKWFGVLVPSSLRRSQADFRRAVESSVRLVNYQEELMKIVVEYRKISAKSSEE